jgi:hypothetical protein
MDWRLMKDAARESEREKLTRRLKRAAGNLN